MRKDLTAILVLCNEEKLMKRCLDSVIKVTKNILVIHDGPCHDNTLVICKKYGCHIYIREKAGEAEAHRAWSFSKVKTEWILQIDADEYLSNELIENMGRLANNKNVDCWELLWPYYNGKVYCTKKWPYKKALFRKNKIKFVALPHEEVVVDGVVKKTHLKLNHEPYYDNFSIKQFVSKHQKWIQIHARYMLLDPSKYDRFPKNNNLKPHYYFIAKHPLLLLFPIFLYHFAGSMYLGGVREGWYGFRNSFMQSLYYFLLCMKIAQLKLKRIIQFR